MDTRTKWTRARIWLRKKYIKLGHDVVKLPNLCSESGEICGIATRPVQAVNQT
jgi:hypothetical protein